MAPRNNRRYTGTHLHQGAYKEALSRAGTGITGFAPKNERRLGFHHSRRRGKLRLPKAIFFQDPLFCLSLTPDDAGSIRPHFVAFVIILGGGEGRVTAKEEGKEGSPQQ